jgi:protein TonB
VAFSIVVLLHVVLGWALVNGLARRVVEVIKGPIETKIIEEHKEPPPPPENLPPPPKFQPPPPSFVPPPEVVVNPPPQVQPSITATNTPPPVVAPRILPTAPDAPPAPKIAARPAVANASACAPTAEDYPPAAQRAEATGTTKVRFTVDGEGKLVKAEVVKSAGSSREHKMLDRVALDKLSQCHFTPGVDEQGRKVGGSFDVEYVWKLE